MVRVGRHDGKLWALPSAYGGNATALFYNRNLQATTERYASAKPVVEGVYAGKETVKQAFTTLHQQFQAVLDRTASGQ